MKIYFDVDITSVVTCEECDTESEYNYDFATMSPGEMEGVDWNLQEEGARQSHKNMGFVQIGGDDGDWYCEKHAKETA